MIVRTWVYLSLLVANSFSEVLLSGTRLVVINTWVVKQHYTFELPGLTQDFTLRASFPDIQVVDLKVLGASFTREDQSISITIHAAQAKNPKLEIFFVVGKALVPTPATAPLFAEQYVEYVDYLSLLSFDRPVNLGTSFQWLPEAKNPSVHPTVSSLSTEVVWVNPSKLVISATNLTERGSPITFYWKHPSPLPYLAHVKRLIELSDWGPPQITEYFHLKNGALKSDTGFIYNRPESVRHSISHLNAVFPEGAQEVEFFDQAGNVSSSSAVMSLKHNRILAQLHPRFAVLGGWETNFNLYYQLPTAYQGKIGQRAWYNLTFGHPFEQIYPTDLLETEIIFPAGAENIRVQGLGGEDENNLEYFQTYGWFDTCFPRKGVRIQKTDLYNQLPMEVSFDSGTYQALAFKLFSLALALIVLTLTGLLISNHSSVVKPSTPKIKADLRHQLDELAFRLDALNEDSQASKAEKDIMVENLVSRAKTTLVPGFKALSNPMSGNLLKECLEAITKPAKGSPNQVAQLFERIYVELDGTLPEPIKKSPWEWSDEEERVVGKKKPVKGKGQPRNRK